MNRRKESAARYAVRVADGRHIVAFRQPAGTRIGDGDNLIAAHERRVAVHCIAVLGAGDPYTWVDPDSAASVARCDPSARVVPAHEPVTGAATASGMCRTPGCEGDAKPDGLCGACGVNNEEDPLS